MFSNIFPFEFANESNKLFSKSDNYIFNSSSYYKYYDFFYSNSGYS